MKRSVLDKVEFRTAPMVYYFNVIFYCKIIRVIIIYGYSKHFVVNFIVFREGKVLLEKDYKIGWKLPGGHVEDNEEIPDTVRREALEELGIEVDFFHKPLFNISEDVYSLPVPLEMFVHKVEKDSKLNSVHQNIGLVYLVSPIGEPTGKENQEVAWFSKEEIEKNDFHKAVKLICLEAFKQISK